MTIEDETNRWIAEAYEIGNSGRWASLNLKIKHLVNNSDIHEAWHTQVLAALCSQNFSEYLALKTAHEKNPEPSLLAWRARNLLEITVWTIYCSTNRENARIFYEDAGRDVKDIYKTFIEWGRSTSQNDEWLSPLVKAQEDVSQNASLEGIETLDGAYKKVSDIAQKCGLGQHYKTYYKMLSKFCHPTAMLMMAIPDDEKEEKQKDVFYYLGTMFFVGNFTALEDCLSSIQLTKPS